MRPFLGMRDSERRATAYPKKTNTHSRALPMTRYAARRLLRHMLSGRMIGRLNACGFGGAFLSRRAPEYRVVLKARLCSLLWPCFMSRLSTDISFGAPDTGLTPTVPSSWPSVRGTRSASTTAAYPQFVQHSVRPALRFFFTFSCPVTRAREGNAFICLTPLLATWSPCLFPKPQSSPRACRKSVIGQHSLNFICL